MLSPSPHSTLKLGQDFGETLDGSELVLFSGVLGAGKTVFIRGIAEALKVKSKITSPTFNIFRIYDCVFPKTGEKGEIYHFDAYRLKKYADLETLGFSEILQEKNSAILLEWPECIADKDLLAIKDRKVILVEIGMREGEGREIKIG